MDEIFEDCVLKFQKFKEHSPLDWLHYQLDYGAEDNRYGNSIYKKFFITANKVEYKPPLFGAPKPYPYIPITIKELEDCISIKLDFGEFSLSYTNNKDHKFIFEHSEIKGWVSSNYVLKPSIIGKMLKDMFELEWINNTGNNHIIKIQ